MPESAASQPPLPESGVPRTREELWSAIHAERAQLAEDLARLTPAQWAAPSLCGSWSVEDVVAHLTAAANTGRLRWLRSMLAAGFDADRDNARRLVEHRGATPAETLDRFRAAIASMTARPGTPRRGWARSSSMPRTSAGRSGSPSPRTPLP